MAQDQQQEQPLDAIFGTQATVRVLRALAPGDEHAPPRLAVRTGLSRPAVREALIRLEREGIIQRVGTGRHVLYRLASDYPLTKRIVKLFKAEAKRARQRAGRGAGCVDRDGASAPALRASRSHRHHDPAETARGVRTRGVAAE